MKSICVIWPGHSPLWVNLMSKKIYKRRLRFVQLTDANLLLSNMQKYVSSTDQHITLMQRAILSDELGAEDKVKIHFALGKALRDIGDMIVLLRIIKMGI